jgi:ATPase subunit of ABC transporter with duplicated ATPase domains
MQNHITVVDLSYRLPDGAALFASVNFSFGGVRTGLIGDNGIGKTTLLDLLSGRKQPWLGTVVRAGRVAYLTQALAPLQGSVAATIGVSQVFESLERIERGSADARELATSDTLWEIAEKLTESFGRLGISHISIDQPAITLSGGELMRVRLAGLLLEDPDFLLLDEPTNHLDLDARGYVYRLISGWDKGLIVVTHDRKLLSLVDQVAELESSGIRAYGGDYAFYREQRQIEKAAAEQNFAGARTRLKKAERAAQLARERQQKRNSAGHKKALRTGISAMAAGNLKRAAENSAARLSDRHQKKVEGARQEMMAARDLVSVETRIIIDLESTRVPRTRRMIETCALNYRYPGVKDCLWKTPLELLVVGPERIHLKGQNGSGKSTLIDLICGKKTPTVGAVKIGGGKIGLLDQNVDVLDDSLSVLDNVKRTSSRRPDHDLRILLGRFLFYHDAALKRASVLSGGERMRAGLACLLAADQAPEILILDEPTNNLDLRSLESVASALCAYRGTLIVVSHDVTFLQDIGIERELELSPGGLGERRNVRTVER